MPQKSPFLAAEETHIDMLKARFVNPSLVHRLKRYDPNLRVYWDNAVGRWGVAVNTPKGLRFVALWQTDDGDPLPLDERLLAAIASWDLRPHRLNAPKDANELADMLERKQEESDDRVWRTFDDDISHLTRNNRRQLIRALERA